MGNKEVKVLGIDPAPTKNSVIFDGEKFCEKEPKALKTYVEKLSKDYRWLICWDAPLAISEKNFWIRDIEINLQEYFKIKKNCEGVSVMPYATCPHWAITNFVFGLPNFENKSALGNFKLITKQNELKSFLNNNTDNGIVEVHPAVAMGIWLDAVSKYKKNKENTLKLWEKLKELDVFKDYGTIEIDNDDKLDALVAYVLGKNWLLKNNTIKLYGDETGSMLLPLF